MIQICSCVTSCVCVMLCLVVWDRSPHCRSTRPKLHRTPDADIIVNLSQLFSAFNSAEQSRIMHKTHMFTEASDGESRTQSVPEKLNDDNLSRYHRNVEEMLRCCGFVVERRPSTLTHGGTGVFVARGVVRAGSITSLYPGIVCSCVGMK